jgi:hypothetical protein
MKRNYLIREVSITIGNRTEMLIVENFYNEDFYFCKFSIRDDNEKNFYNRYDAFGFYVELKQGNASFKLRGKIDKETATEIWKQTLPQLEVANSTDITIPVNF